MIPASVEIKVGREYRYAQAKGGLKLHLVEAWKVFGAQRVSPRALCGYVPARWRMTINVPLAHACERCQNVASKMPAYAS